MRPVYILTYVLTYILACTLCVPFMKIDLRNILIEQRVLATALLRLNLQLQD